MFRPNGANYGFLTVYLKIEFFSQAVTCFLVSRTETDFDKNLTLDCIETKCTSNHFLWNPIWKVQSEPFSSFWLKSTFVTLHQGHCGLTTAWASTILCRTVVSTPLTCIAAVDGVFWNRGVGFCFSGVLSGDSRWMARDQDRVKARWARIILILGEKRMKILREILV